MALYKELIPRLRYLVLLKYNSVYQPEQLKTPQITNHNLYTSDNNAKNFPEVGGLYDTRLGVVDSNLICETCKYRTLCPGHTGHIILNKPVFYMNFISKVLKYYIVYALDVLNYYYHMIILFFKIIQTKSYKI